MVELSLRCQTLLEQTGAPGCFPSPVRILFFWSLLFLAASGKAWAVQGPVGALRRSLSACSQTLKKKAPNRRSSGDIIVMAYLVLARIVVAHILMALRSAGKPLQREQLSRIYRVGSFGMVWRCHNYIRHNYTYNHRPQTIITDSDVQNWKLRNGQDQMSD